MQYLCEKHLFFYWSTASIPHNFSGKRNNTLPLNSSLSFIVNLNSFWVPPLSCAPMIESTGKRKKKTGILFFHWTSLRLFVSIHNKINWLAEVNIKVFCHTSRESVARNQSVSQNESLEPSVRFPRRLTQRCAVGNRVKRGAGRAKKKKVTFPELILIRGFRQTKCIDLAALQATSHSDAPLRRHRADISRRSVRRVSVENGWGGGRRVAADAFETCSTASGRRWTAKIDTYC